MNKPIRQPTHASLARDILLRPRTLAVLCLVAVMAAASLSTAVAQGDRLPAFAVDPSLPGQIVLNPEQGLGQCHWLDRDILSLPLVSWGYDSGEASSGWDALEPQEGVFNWAPMDEQVAKARSLGRQIWLELHTSEGHVPPWAVAAGVPLVGSRGGTPVPWNVDYQRLLRKAIHAMAARYDDDPTVEAITVMAGGCYGEMAICAPQADRRDWEQAGYSDDVFIEAVKQILDLYLEEQYTWKDGSQTHGFLRTPVVLQVGSGLYGHTRAVIEPVVQYALSKYGLRVWLKYNGWGGENDMGWLYQDYSSVTRVGYEPMGNSADFVSRPEIYIQAALDQHASFICLQGTYFNIIDSKWQQAREMAARYLGAQILLQAIEAPKSVVPGQEYKFVSHWVNRGTVPLMRPERMGQKDIPGSYEVSLALVDPVSGESVLEHRFVPSVPTTRWFGGQPIQIEEAVRFPDTVPPGEYDLQVGLVNPDLPAHDGNRLVRLIYGSGSDGSGRYTVGRIQVQQATVPTLSPAPPPQPTAVSTPSEGSGQTGSGLLAILRRLWTWLHSWIGRLRYFAHIEGNQSLVLTWGARHL
jgi:hypothetical protein